jgi:hypothetical protein
MKYAFKSVVNRRLRPEVEDYVLSLLMTFSFHYPVLIPLMRDILRQRVQKGDAKIAYQFNKLLLHHATYHRSDAMCWILHFMRKLRLPVGPSQFRAVLDSGDCLAILACYFAVGKAQRARIVSFIVGLDTTDQYTLDSQWMLIYEMFRRGEVSNPYGNDEIAFDILKKADIGFINLRTF